MKAATWVLAKARVKLGLVIIVSLIILLLLSRPLFYVVLAKNFVSQCENCFSGDPLVFWWCCSMQS